MPVFPRYLTRILPAVALALGIVATAAAQAPPPPPPPPPAAPGPASPSPTTPTPMPPSGPARPNVTPRAGAGEEWLGRMVVGNTVFVFLHEVGHGLLDLLSLPVIGTEEDVVDEFATLVLLEGAREGETAAYQIAADVADGWAAMWQITQRQVGDMKKFPYWDEHNLDIKRAYNVACLFYGSNPRAFSGILEQINLPPQRAARCVREYEEKRQSWLRLLGPHMRKPGENRPGGRLIVNHRPVQSPFAQQMAREIQASRIYELLAGNLSQTFVIPQDVEVNVGECGMPNAFWDPDNRTVNMCYELMAFFTQAYALVARDPGGPWGGSGTTAQTPPLPDKPPQTPFPPQQQPFPPQQQPFPPQQQPFPPQQQGSVAGTWAIVMTEPATGVQVSYQLALSGDGRYMATMQRTGATMRSWGNWQQHPDVIVFLLQGSDMPGAQVGMRETMPYRLLSATQMQTPLGVLQRIQ